MLGYKDFTGKRYGSLVAISNTMLKSNRGCYIWNFLCDCGREELRQPSILEQHLKKGNISTCKVCLVDALKERSITHNDSKSWLYKRWTKIKLRCSDPTNKDYKNYGAIGVKISQEFMDFEIFREYMSSLDNYDPSYSIDRLDPRGNYERGNIRWANSKQQARNRSSFKKGELPNGVNIRLINGNKWYRANWRGLDGKKHEKMYSVNKLGEELALFLATETRDLAILRLNLLGADYSPYHGNKGEQQ